MLVDIVEVKALPDKRLFIRFKDGTQGIVDLAKHVPFTGVFAVLKDDGNFNKVRVNAELGTICWPNGADLDPDVLYALVKGEAIPDLSRET